jgi:CheY-like chemotaxis protein
VLYAHDGVEGWEMARTRRPDVIVCDFRMPNMDGLELAGRLKAAAETKDVPLVMLTSEDFSPEVQKALRELGVAEYVHKSSLLPELLAAVKRATGE